MFKAGGRWQIGGLQMKHAMQHQYGNFLFNRVAELLRLNARQLGRNGDFPQLHARPVEWKGEDIRGIILPKKSCVQPLQFFVVGDKNSESPTRRYRAAKFFCKPSNLFPVQSPRGISK